MKKNKLFLLMIFMTLVIVSCKKQNKVLTEINTAAVTEKKQDVQAVEKENENVKKESVTIEFENNGQPIEVDIDSSYPALPQDWYVKRLSEDEKYYIYESEEYTTIYNRYCIPVEGERKDLNLMVLKEDTYLFEPNDMGSDEKLFCSNGCEFVPVARSKEPLIYNGKKSYWLKISDALWLPGASVCIQTGAFEKLPVEDLEIKFFYEKIKDGAWFVVKTDDGSSLRLRDSSNFNTSKVISSFAQGTWIYTESQTTAFDTIDGIEGRWYKIKYPEEGYVFGGYLEKQDGVHALEYSKFDIFYYPYDESKGFTFKVYSAPTVKSNFLGEYEIKPEEYGYPAFIETKKMETVDGVQGVWLHINKPVEGFIFGHNLIYK